jgi:hypothetical protein
VLWAPGNHELWTTKAGGRRISGPEKYHQLVSICRQYGVLTPEDPYATWEGENSRQFVLAPLFLLYDYSFRPESIPQSRAVRWAAASGVVCADEMLINPHPYSSVSEWCEHLCANGEERLRRCAGKPTVLINHFPLRSDLVTLPQIPRFSIWCGTSRTEDWHLRFNAQVVVSGHLHVRSTRWRDRVRFEEVSLGYPRQWCRERGLSDYLREILPGPACEPPSD